MTVFWPGKTLADLEGTNMRFVATHTNEPRREYLNPTRESRFFRIFPWSFYELGTTENSRVSASLSYVWD